MRLNLLIGIQSMEDYALKIDVNAGPKLKIKKFRIPTMKKILVAVLANMLKNSQSSFSFSRPFLRTVIEKIHLFGISLDTYKR